MVVRAAFDIGSGATKLVIARMKQCTSKGFAVDEVLYSHETEMLLAHDLLRNRSTQNRDTFSSHVVEELFGKMDAFVKVCEKHEVTEFCGVCTHAFRLADNGPEVISQLGHRFQVPLQLIGQNLEGLLGFRTGVAALNLAGVSHDPEHVVVWDTGGGSFQLSTSTNGMQEAYVVKGPIGSASVTEAAVRTKGDNFDTVQSANPFSSENVRNLRAWIGKTLAPVESKVRSDSLLNTTRSTSLVGIGGNTCAFRICAAITNKLTADEGAAIRIEKLELDDAINLHLEQPDEHFVNLGIPQPGMVIPKAILVSSVLNMLNVDHFTYVHTTGSCLGVLESKEFWRPTSGDAK